MKKILVSQIAQTSINLTLNLNESRYFNPRSVNTGLILDRCSCTENRSDSDVTPTTVRGGLVELKIARFERLQRSERVNVATKAPLEKRPIRI